MDAFLDHAFRNLPGGLILVDLRGKIRAINQTAETILGLSGPAEPGTDCTTALAEHPKLAKILLSTCEKLEPVSRQEISSQRPDGEKIVLGYSTLILKDSHGEPIGVGLSFQDITRFIPLMDAHQFLDIALKNLPGGLVFIDLQGKIRGVNVMAERILGLKESIEPGTECYKALADYPPIVKVLLATTQSLTAANRQEMTTRRADGEKIMLGYGTLILRNPQGQPVGVGLTFQDITRYIPLPLKAEFIRVVNRFFTPFAIALVLAALFLGFAETRAKVMAVGLVVFLGIFNEVSAALSKRKVEWTARIGTTRIITNFAANVLLVYWLGTFWGPMWLLFVLTPVATALYADWKKTILTALISAGALLGIYWSRGLEGSVGWGQASIHAAFIVFISLFVNSIARLVMQMRSAAPAAASKPALNVIAASRPAPKETSKKLAA